MHLKEKAAAGVDVRGLTQFIALAGTATILPFFIHLQWITGPIVNAIFVLSLFILGIRSALLICLIPSLMALAGGLLPVVLAPAVPFIMIGNVIFVLTIEFFYSSIKNEFMGYWAGIFLGAALKFIFLFLSVSLISNLLIKQDLLVKVAQMMSWSQFFTAVSGGMIAWMFLVFLKRF
jgi:hypothetical protein